MGQNGASFNPTKRTRTTRQYDAATGRLEASTTNLDGSLAQAYSFGWTPAGDLEYRLDSIGGQAEDFEHDALHRLIESDSGGVARTFAYDVLGNFIQKDGVGTYHYDTDGARLLYTDDGTSSTTYGYDDNGAVTSFGSTAISWTSFGKAREITSGAQLRRMEYDADGARVIRYAGDEITVTAHGLYERRYDARGNLEEARFKAPNAAGAVVGEFRFNYEPSDPQPWLRTTTRYVHDDHLGSAGLITDEQSNEVDRVAYDAWGRARDPSDWNVYLAEGATDDLPVGFTGHQAELDGGLINMRGRMYDPRLGRFMSVDPLIENPINAQTWNPYSYVQNRPLTARDPSGLGADDGGGESPDADIEKAAENAGNPGDKCSAGRSGDVTVQVCSDGAMPAVPLEAPGGGGPVGAAYWGTGGGSGVGMRGQNDIDVLGGIGDLATRTALRDEMNFWAAVGGQCGVQGSMLVCGFKPLGGEKSVQEAMAGAFALNSLLDAAAPWIPVAGGFTDIAEGIDAAADGEYGSAAVSFGMAIAGLVPGGRGVKLADKAADVADAAHDASKAVDAVGDASKAAKGSHITSGAKQGRQNRVDWLEVNEFDPNQPKHVRGWLKNERRRVKTGNGSPKPRNPPGYVQAHGRSTPAREGFDYSNAKLQHTDLNRLEESVRRRKGRP